MPRKEFQFTEGSSNEFWAIELKDTGFVVHFGKIGTSGQIQEKSFSTAEMAKKAHDKLITEKLRKGYVEVTAGSISSSSAPVGRKEGEKSAAVKDALDRAIAEHDLRKHRKWLHEHARPAVGILKTSEPVTQGGSKLGGNPDVPDGFKWPEHGRYQYRFAAQFDLATIPSMGHGLPESGLLSIFHLHQEDDVVFAGESDFLRVFHFGKEEALRTLDPPEGAECGPACAVTLQPGVDVPISDKFDGYLFEADLEEEDIGEFDKSADAYSELRSSLEQSGHYLLGYPRYNTLSYDPTPGPEWTSLLTVGTDDELDWFWGNGRLMAFIEKDRLSRCDFSNIKCDSG